MKTHIVRTIKINLDICPAEAAQIFAEFDSGQMAAFFNELAAYIDKTYTCATGSFCMQLQSVTDDPALTHDARHIMTLIGEYAPNMGHAPIGLRGVAPIPEALK